MPERSSSLFDDVEQAPARPDLPPLTGTRKQIDFCAGVQAREKKLAECYRWIAERRQLAAIWEQRGQADKADAVRDELQRAADQLERLEAETFAGFWLDQRQLCAADLLHGRRKAREW